MSKEALQLLLGYLLLVNLTAFVLMGLDKRRARRDKWRISEKTLFLPGGAGREPWVHCGDAPVSPQDEALVLPVRPARPFGGPDPPGGFSGKAASILIKAQIDGRFLLLFW